MIKLTIDGKTVEAREGQSVLHAALDGGCRSPICATTLTSRPRVVAACAA